MHDHKKEQERRLSSRQTEVGVQLSHIASDDLATRQPLLETSKRLSDLLSRQIDVLADPNLLDLHSMLKRDIPHEVLSDNDVGKLNTFADFIGLMFDDCRKRGGFTPLAAEFYKKYIELDAQKEKYTELFGEKPPF